MMFQAQLPIPLLRALILPQRQKTPPQPMIQQPLMNPQLIPQRLPRPMTPPLRRPIPQLTVKRLKKLRIKLRKKRKRLSLLPMMRLSQWLRRLSQMTSLRSISMRRTKDLPLR